MKTAFYLLGLLLLAGCVQTHNKSSASPSLCFIAGDRPGCWEARHFDFQQIALEYARQKKLAFDFEKTGCSLLIRPEGASLVTQIMYFHRPGELFLALDIDPFSGKVLSHRLDYARD